MAELLALASNLLSTIKSPVFQMAYKKLSLTDDLNELTKFIEKVQSALCDAHRRQQTDADVKDWIERVSNVLLDADDLFDEVATDYILGQQISGDNNRLVRKVRLFLPKLSPLIARSPIAKKVKPIRNRLLEIAAEMGSFRFRKFAEEEPAYMRRREETSSSGTTEEVIGRDQDKKALLEMLFDESIDSYRVPVIAIVGEEGIGKSTLSQLVLNDERVVMNFEKRWFARISKTSNDKQFLGKIFQSIRGENFSDFSVWQLTSKIQDSVKGTKCLLVLDDVWDDDHARWQDRMILLSGGAKGSRIIVTTRSLSVASAVGASKTYKLGALSDDESWHLFKMAAGFTPEKEKVPIWENLGREILKKCANVPLAVITVASLLRSKSGIEHWESYKLMELRELYDCSRIMDTLKFSYDTLPKSRKLCFAYCSLFPKDSEFEIKKLVYLWMAQGYTTHSDEGETFEQVGYSYSKDLLMYGLFEAAKVDEYGEVVTCKMHALVYDMAQDVAREDIIRLTQSSKKFENRALHVGVDFERGDPGEILESLVDNKRLRSLVIMNGGSQKKMNGGSCDLALDQLFTNLRFLRALSLSRLGIVNVSYSVGELKHLRYLDLSHSSFASLPDSMMNLVNLLTLDIEGCYNLKQLPDNFRKLVNLRCLNNTNCYQLKHMPPGIGELAYLQYLSSFKVGIATQGVQWSGLDALDGLTQLTGELLIDFETGIEDWYGDESWQLPVSPQRLHIWEYPGRRIPRWDSERSNNLSTVQLGSCSEVRYLPPLRSLPHLRILSLRGLQELEYMEEEEIEIRDKATITKSSVGLFFPCLKQLELRDLPKLKGWSMRFAAHQEGHSLLSFGLLFKLTIINSPRLKSIPLYPKVQKLELYSMDSKRVHQLLSPCSNSPSPLEDLSITNCEGLLDFPNETLTSLKNFYIERCNSLESLPLLSRNLLTVVIKRCQGLKSLEFGSLQSLKIEYCNQLMNLKIAYPSEVEELFISDCPELKLWESQDKRWPLDWLRHRVAVRQLQITAKPIAR